jgi:putative copper export protein
LSVTGWSLVRFVHVLCAMVWVGGQLVLSGIVLPVLRSGLDPAAREVVAPRAARRFGLVANVALLPLLLASGIALAWHRGVTIGTFEEPGYGRLLGTKLVLVAAAIALAALHGIKASRNPGSGRPYAIASLAASVGIVVFATALVP